MEQKVKTKKVANKQTKVSSAKPKTTSKKTRPTFEQIQLRAYQIYVENGYKGSEVDNWLKAEKEFK